MELKIAKRIFDLEVETQKQYVLQHCELEEAQKRIEQMDKKVIHTGEVVRDGLKTLQEISANESVAEFLHLALLDHDIGRFAQMSYTGNYNDANLKEFGYRNHGELGKRVLDTRILEQVPDMPCYHEPIKTIVGNHVDGKVEYKELLILLSDLLKNYSIEELLKDINTRDSIIGSTTQIVQDVDRLDIYHQILDGRWTPMKVEDDIDPKVFDMFYRGEYLNMAKLKEQGLWNANVGELVRLGFINQIKLLSVAKLIKEEDIIMRLKSKRQNPKAKDAFDYANELLDQMINTSENGIIVGKTFTK